MPAELREMAQAKAPDALRVALGLMDKADSEQVKLAAAREILDRGYGKAPQSTELSINIEDLQAFAAQVITIIGAEVSDEPTRARIAERIAAIKAK